MIIINPPVTYHDLKRIDSPYGRKYATPTGEKLPSVTEILGKTGDKTALIEWRKRVGDEEANRISKESTGLGTLVHKHVENFILGEDRPGGTNDVRILAASMADNIINQGLCAVDEIWAMEQPLYYPGLYAGTADLIGVYQGEPAIMDHKTSKMVKKEEWVQDYFMQLAAYALAHNEVYGTNIRKGAIFMAARDGGYKTFVLEGSKWDAATESWIKRVDEFYS
jgi:genome maintenance exonuclease 1